MIDHIGLAVTDYQKSKEFYLAALKPLDFELIMEFGDHCGLGVKGKPEFWLAKEVIGKPNHLAFRAKDRATVDEFYKAAIAAGGKDNGAPGIREMYHPNYYGAFVLDFDGHNIEAVCHDPQ
jgi:catechol 2,3-dioxygenase-like lactoylglutathione lyase family enzyme